MKLSSKLQNIQRYHRYHRCELRKSGDKLINKKLQIEVYEIDGEISVVCEKVCVKVFEEFAYNLYAKVHQVIRIMSSYGSFSDRYKRADLV